MELVLIRHGESLANAQRVIQGHFDSALSEQGRFQASALAEALHHDRFAAIYSSDLSRARETGETIAERLGLPLRVEPRLREIDIGCFTGLAWPEIAQRFPQAYAAFQASRDWSVVPGAEHDVSVRGRLDDLVAILRAEHAEQRVALVAHGAILRRFLHTLLGLPFPSGVFFELHNASYSEVHLTDQGPTLLYLNRVPPEAAAQLGTRTLI